MRKPQESPVKPAGSLFPLLLVLPFIAMAVVVLAHGVPDYPSSGDGALLETSTRWLLSHRVMLGPYSRFVFFHPGPMYFILRYPLYMIFGMRSLSFLITTSLLGGASLFCAQRAVSRCGPRGAAVAFCCVFAGFLALSGPEYWLSEWNPMVIALPMVLFFVCAAAIASAYTGYGTLAALAFTFAAQTHMGAIPAMVVTGVAALVMRWFPGIPGSGRPAGAGRGSGSLLVTSAVLLVLWAPPLAEEVLSRPEGNISRIAAFMAETRPEHGFTDVYGDWSRMVTAMEVTPFRRVLHGAGLLNAFLAALPPLRMTLLALCFMALRRRGDAGFSASLCLVALVLHFASFYSGLQIRGERLVYLFEWMRVLSPLSITALVLSALHLRSWREGHLKAAAAAAGVLLLVSASVSTRATLGYLPPLLEPVNNNDRAVASMSAQLMDWLSERPQGVTVFVLRTPGVWPVMTGLSNALEKNGYATGMQGITALRTSPPPAGATVTTLHLGRSNDPAVPIPGTVASFEDIVAVLPPE